MLIKDDSKNSNVKFISYTGSYPNLCSGTLTLEIDGIEYIFGEGYKEPKPDFGRFWYSGGGITNDYESTYDGEWTIDIDSLPEQFRKYSFEIDRIFNENVEWGCCGGCI